MSSRLALEDLRDALSSFSGKEDTRENRDKIVKTMLEVGDRHKPLGVGGMVVHLGGDKIVVSRSAIPGDENVPAASGGSLFDFLSDDQ
jgi:hypothetical protein